MKPPRVRRQHVRSSLAALMNAGKTPQTASRVATIRTVFRNMLARPWPSIMEPSLAEDLNYQLSQADTICRRESLPTRVAA